MEPDHPPGLESLKARGVTPVTWHHYGTRGNSPCPCGHYQSLVLPPGLSPLAMGFSPEGKQSGSLIWFAVCCFEGEVNWHWGSLTTSFPLSPLKWGTSELSILCPVWHTEGSYTRDFFGAPPPIYTTCGGSIPHLLSTSSQCAPSPQPQVQSLLLHLSSNNLPLWNPVFLTLTLIFPHHPGWKSPASDLCPCHQWPGLPSLPLQPLLSTLSFHCRPWARPLWPNDPPSPAHPEWSHLHPLHSLTYGPMDWASRVSQGTC